MPAKRGPRGRKGKHGARGARGQPGKRGDRGPIGQRGAKGKRGPAGPAPNRAQILAAVEGQLADIRRQLEIQLTRFGQLQAQVDHIHGLLKQVVQETE